MGSSWFARAMEASALAVGPKAARTMAILGSLPVQAVRTNLAEGLAYAASRGRDLWRHQSEATEAIRRHLLETDNDPTALVIMPTGSGKTEIILRTVEASGLDVDDIRLAVPTIVLEPTRQLVSQTLEAFRERFPKLHVSALTDGTSLPASVTLMTYDLFVDMLGDGRLHPADVRAVVMDEAHRGLSDLRQDLIGKVLGKAVVTAYSATPAFDSVKNVHALLGARNEVARVSDERMRRERIISPLVDYVLRVGVEGQLPEDKAERTQILRRACENAVLNFVSSHVEPATGIRLRDKTYLGYVNGIARAKEMARTLSGCGMPAEAVSGEDSISAIRASLSRLSSGETRVVVNDLVLGEGTDVPEARGILAFSPTTSLVKHQQRCGRARRIDPRFAPDDDRQVTSVVEVLVEVNGVCLPGQKIYADAIGDLSCVRLVRCPQQSVAGLAAELREGDPPGRAGTDLTAAGSWSLTSDDLHSVHYFLENRDLPACPEDYLSWAVVSSAMHQKSSSPTMARTLQALEASLRAGAPALVAGQPVRAGLYCLPNGMRGVCVHRDDVGAFRILFGERHFSEKWSEGWFALKNVAAMLSASEQSPRLKSIWNDAREGRLQLPPAPDGGPGLRVMRRRHHLTLYAHETAAQVIMEAFGHRPALSLPRKPPGHVTYSTMCQGLHVGQNLPSFKEAWAGLVALCESHGDVVVDGRRIGFGLYRTVKNDPAYFIAEADVPWFLGRTDYHARRLALVKPDGWLTRDEVLESLGLEGKDVQDLNTYWNKQVTPQEHRGGWGLDRFALFEKGPEAFCIPRERLPALEGAFRAWAANRASVPITPDWATLSKVLNEHAPDGPLHTRLKNAWASLEAQSPDEGGGPYRLLRRQGAKVGRLCMHVDDVHAFVTVERAALSNLLDNDGWLTKQRAAARLRGIRSTQFDEAWQLAVSLAQEGPIKDGGSDIAFASRRFGVRNHWCLHESDLPWLADLSGLHLVGDVENSEAPCALEHLTAGPAL